MNIKKQDFIDAVAAAVEAPSKSGSKWDELESLFSASGLRGNGAINNGGGADRTTRVRQLATSKRHSGQELRGLAEHSVFVLGGGTIPTFHADKKQYVQQIVDALTEEHPRFQTCIVMVAEADASLEPVCLVKRSAVSSLIGYEDWWPKMQVIVAEDPGMISEGRSPYRTGGVGSNIIFFGPPGTGKSTMVKRRVGAGTVFRTQFHPEYSHSDFVGSYRPVVGSELLADDLVIGHDGQKISRPVNYFSFVPGPFTLALEAAYRSEGHVYLVIEEINRGDCAAIFGDIFQLLDRDDSGTSEFGINPKPEMLAYLKAMEAEYDVAGDGRLHLPSNLSVFATMNTSDQSLYPMDAAFKRRWQWVACPIDLDDLLKHTGGNRPYVDDGRSRWDWIRLLELINRNIVRDRSEDKQIGPWFIKPSKSGEILWDDFLNKCLFYLWHDAFKDEQRSDFSPFRSDGPAVFSEVQAEIRANGLESGLKPELLFKLEATAPQYGNEGTSGPKATGGV